MEEIDVELATRQKRLAAIKKAKKERNFTDPESRIMLNSEKAFVGLKRRGRKSFFIVEIGLRRVVRPGVPDTKGLFYPVAADNDPVTTDFRLRPVKLPVCAAQLKPAQRPAAFGRQSAANRSKG